MDDVRQQGWKHAMLLLKLIQIRYEKRSGQSSNQ